MEVRGRLVGAIAFTSAPSALKFVATLFSTMPLASTRDPKLRFTVVVMASASPLASTTLI